MSWNHRCATRLHGLCQSVQSDSSGWSSRQTRDESKMICLHMKSLAELPSGVGKVKDLVAMQGLSEVDLQFRPKIACGIFTWRHFQPHFPWFWSPESKWFWCSSGMIARCSRRSMTTCLAVQLVILPVVHAQRDAVSQGSFVAAVTGLVIVAIIIILAVGCSQRFCRRTAAKVPQVEHVSCVACGSTGCGLCGVKAAEPIATSSDLKVVPSDPPHEEEAIDRGPSSSVCNFSNPPTPAVPRLFVFQTPSKICSGRVEHI
eukprot:s2156_g5.t1